MSGEATVRAYIRGRGVLALMSLIEEYVEREERDAQVAGHNDDARRWNEVRRELIKTEGALRLLNKGEML